MPSSATKQLRTGRPISERIGMFCRFGLTLESRPVAAATWLNVVWIRPGLRIDQVRQRVEVGVLELGELAPALHLGDDLVLVADLGEHAGVGREAGLAAALLGQSQLVEEDLAELLRRADGELAAGEVVDLALELVDPLGHALADLREALRVQLHAGALHGGEHLDQRHLDLVEHALEPKALDLLALAAASSKAKRASVGGSAVGSPSAASESCSLRGSLLPALRGCRARRGEAGIGCELGEVVDAAGRVDQVGGDHRVVRELEGAGGRDGQEPRAAAAALRLGVVEGERVFVNPLGEGGRGPRSRPPPRDRRRCRPSAPRRWTWSRDPPAGQPEFPPPRRTPGSPRRRGRGRPPRTPRRGAASPRGARTRPRRRAGGCDPAGSATPC